jgi:hypothetical protein
MLILMEAKALADAIESSRELACLPVDVGVYGFSYD